MTTSTATGVVEQMLDHVAHARWDQLPNLFCEDFVIIEPASLPYGGAHYGAAGYVALMQRIGGLFELGFALEGVHAVGEATVLLHMIVSFTARASGRGVRLPVLELITLRDRRIARIEVFLGDTAALLQTLG